MKWLVGGCGGGDTGQRLLRLCLEVSQRPRARDSWGRISPGPQPVLLSSCFTVGESGPALSLEGWLVVGKWRYPWTGGFIMVKSTAGGSSEDLAQVHFALLRCPEVSHPHEQPLPSTLLPAFPCGRSLTHAANIEPVIYLFFKSLRLDLGICSLCLAAPPCASAPTTSNQTSSQLGRRVPRPDHAAEAGTWCVPSWLSAEVICLK